MIFVPAIPREVWAAIAHVNMDAAVYGTGMWQQSLPGGIVHVPITEVYRSATCKGCGAPLASHVCSYCRRPTS